YIDRFVPGAANAAPLLTIPIPFVPLTISTQALVAIAAVWLLSAVHIRGVGPGRILGNVLAVFKVTALLLFIALGFAFGTGSFGNLSVSGATPSVTNWLFAFIPIMLAYSGWNAASYVAEEIRDPGRNVPKALAIGTIAVIAVYLLLNVLYLYVFSVTELSALKGSVLDIVAERLLGSAAGNIMGIVSIISLLASCSAMTFAGPRVYFAMARDNAFFRSAARVHPVFKTPAVAIVAQSVWTSILILTGSADALLTYTGFSITLFSGIAVAALFVLRSREPNADRPFKALGYPVAPAIFTIAALLIVLNALYNDLVKPLTAGTAVGPSAWGLLVIALGLPVYYFFSRKK
ncbi:MAG: amino acid permease, partial [Acidobacteriota bacterium]